MERANSPPVIERIAEACDRLNMNGKSGRCNLSNEGTIPQKDYTRNKSLSIEPAQNLEEDGLRSSALSYRQHEDNGRSPRHIPSPPRSTIPAQDESENADRDAAPQKRPHKGRNARQLLQGARVRWRLFRDREREKHFQIEERIQTTLHGQESGEELYRARRAEEESRSQGDAPHYSDEEPETDHRTDEGERHQSGHESRRTERRLRAAWFLAPPKKRSSIEDCSHISGAGDDRQNPSSGGRHSAPIRLDLDVCDTPSGCQSRQRVR